MRLLVIIIQSVGPTINGYTIAPSAIGYLTEQSTDGTYGHLVFATRNVTTDTSSI